MTVEELRARGEDGSDGADPCPCGTGCSRGRVKLSSALDQRHPSLAP